MKNFKKHLELSVLSELSQEQINELLVSQTNKINELKKQLKLYRVSNRRELLIDFRNWWYGNRHSANVVTNDEIDDFLGN